MSTKNLYENSISMRSSFRNLLILFVSACASVHNTFCDTICVAYAIDADLKPLQGEQSITGKAGHAIKFAIGRNTVYAVKMGSGCVETALSIASVLSRIRCDYVVAIGPAAALDENVAVGSIYRVVEVTGHQVGSSDSSGFHLAATAKITLSTLGDHLRVFDSQPPAKIASGEEFVASSVRAQSLRSGADLVDMNLFGAVKACEFYETPLYAWKIVSDHATDNAPQDFRNFIAAYKGKLGIWIKACVTSLQANPNDPASYDAIRKALGK